MDRLAPQHVPIYESGSQRRSLWEECANEDRPVVGIRDARRGYIVRYDLQHLDAELSRSALRDLRARTRAQRTYPTGSTDSYPAGTDPISAAEGVGGEAGPVSGELHADTETEARELASRLSEIVFESERWR
ncbi:hypothetical protein GRX03_12860 [Halovenus sp. WSH3]|uniref:Uncharacterized protein n=1 Tax=Halovenus carboxidivorans TaxID=2692199 RepID=A0A6B0TA70_9EURY|nr:hypothetical protein [Halovenus carboxidivorans]MXR52493.1 hypothetical protein [Halovenus carboxidivorans]